MATIIIIKIRFVPFIFVENDNSEYFPVCLKRHVKVDFLNTPSFSPWLLFTAIPTLSDTHGAPTRSHRHVHRRRVLAARSALLAFLPVAHACRVRAVHRGARTPERDARQDVRRAGMEQLWGDFQFFVFGRRSIPSLTGYFPIHLLPKSTSLWGVADDLRLKGAQ
jgi:hypothetical protein